MIIKITNGLKSGIVSSQPSSIISYDTQNEHGDDMNDVIAECHFRVGESFNTTKAAKHCMTKLRMNEICNILRTLPIDSGGEDIYRMGTTIHVNSENLRWENMISEGCCNNVVEIYPTDEQLDVFKGIANELNQSIDV